MHILSFETLYTAQKHIFGALICLFSCLFSTLYINMHILLHINAHPNEESGPLLCAAK